MQYKILKVNKTPKPKEPKMTDTVTHLLLARLCAVVEYVAEQDGYLTPEFSDTILDRIAGRVMWARKQENVEISMRPMVDDVALYAHKDKVTFITELVDSLCPPSFGSSSLRDRLSAALELAYNKGAGK